MAVINFVRDYQRLARFRFGRFEGMIGPGVVFKLPIVHKIVRVDLRTEVLDIPKQTNITKANASIRELIPPHEIQEAMNRQMSAERMRRAVVLEADGAKQANITVAEGEKQAVILRAEGERQAAILKAEGYAQALGTIFNVAKTVDTNTMSLQYFDTLKTVGASPASKF